MSQFNEFNELCKYHRRMIRAENPQSHPADVGFPGIVLVILVIIGGISLALLEHQTPINPPIPTPPPAQKQ